MVNKPLVCVMVPCYNEEGNAEPLYKRILAVMSEIPDVRVEILFIDNA